MHTLYQMNPKLHAEVRRKQVQVWDDLIAAFAELRNHWSKRRVRPRWTEESTISLQDVLADLAYGRD